MKEQGQTAKRHSQGKSSVLIVIVVTALVCLFISYILFAYIPGQQREVKIQSYKKAIFQDMSCQYSCPLKEQVIANKSALLPDSDCLKICTKNAQTLHFDPNDFANNELARDGLVNDTARVVGDCKTESVNMTTKRMDSQLFLDCANKGLETLKKQYPYLN